MLSSLGNIFCRRHIEIFFLYFPRNRFWHFMQMVSSGHILQKMSMLTWITGRGDKNIGTLSAKKMSSNMDKKETYAARAQSVLLYCICAQRRLKSACKSAQADQGLRCQSRLWVLVERRKYTNQYSPTFSERGWGGGGGVGVGGYNKTNRNTIPIQLIPPLTTRN